MKILVVEDDNLYAEALKEVLRGQYVVETAPTAAEGLQHARASSFGVIILDLGLPDEDGITFCESLRAGQKNSHTPIMVLTGRRDTKEKIAAFEAGADDYVVKPCVMAELLARLKALSRRRDFEVEETKQLVGKLEVNMTARRVSVNGEEIILRRKEFNLLLFLLRYQGQPVTRTMILDEVWESEIDPATNTVDVHINKLRNKIDKPFGQRLIKTVPGVGYVLAVQ